MACDFHACSNQLPTFAPQILTFQISAARPPQIISKTIAIIKKDIKNLDLIEGVVILQEFIRSSINFTRQPQVLHGASELLIDLLDKGGHHALTATG